MIVFGEACSIGSSPTMSCAIVDPSAMRERAAPAAAMTCGLSGLVAGELT